MEDDVQLSDMLESYPSVMTPGFQTLISEKVEFNELKSSVNERLPVGRGKYFKHQIFTHRFLRAYDDLLILSETGTGKSCEVLGFIEYTRKEFAKAEINDQANSHFKRAIVLVKGPTQKNEFKNQLICRCSDGTYEMDINKRGRKSEKTQKSISTSEIKRAGYIVATYTSFAHRIEEQYPNDEDNDRLAEDYADTIFWIDEAHNLLLDPDVISREKEKEKTYRTLWRLLHVARRSKRILSTATPMINDENEIGSLLNLILPINGIIPEGYDYQNAPENDIRVFFPNLPISINYRSASPQEMAPYFVGQFDRNYLFSSANIEDLEPYLRGRVSFIRAADTGAIPIDQGNKMEPYTMKNEKIDSQIIVYATAMSEFQSQSYVQSKNDSEQHDEKKTSNFVFGDERQASNFVFPDGYWGNGISDEDRNRRRVSRNVNQNDNEVVEFPEDGIINIRGQNRQQTNELRAFKRYVNLSGENYTATPEFLNYLSDPNNIAQSSCKFSAIIEEVKKPGNAFVYGEYVEGSGDIVLALCFEANGFEKYNESSSIFLGASGNTNRSYCNNNDTTTNRRIRPNFQKKLRYALLTRDTTPSKFQSMMETMNSYENRNGDYIKVLISSRVGRDGINVNNILQIHLIGPEWNQGASYQALSRGIRATSHVDLLEDRKKELLQEKRKQLIELGQNPDLATVNSSEIEVVIKIYRHAAVPIDDGNQCIDYQMYRVSEYKDRGIKRIMRILKRCSIGCHVQYNRNVRPTDIDGSANCDYDVCHYDCYDAPPFKNDYSTYDVIYADEVLQEVQYKLSLLYKKKNMYTLSDLILVLPNYRQKYIIMALEYFITLKIPIIDRFGYTTYLHEDNQSFYLDRAYPTNLVKPSVSLSYYTNGLIALDEHNLSDIVLDLDSDEYQIIIKELQGIDSNSPEFNSALDKLDIEVQGIILEQVIFSLLTTPPTPFSTAIINKFKKFLFYISKPVVELENLQNSLLHSRPKRGRKPKADTKRRVKKINPINPDLINTVQQDDNNKVYLHNLYSQIINQTGYATTARYNKAAGRLRLLDPQEPDAKWRDLDENEITIYNPYLQIEIANRIRPFEEKKVYGFILDKRFRIRNGLDENKNASVDARKINRGKVCTTWKKEDLIDLMWELHIPPPKLAYLPDLDNIAPDSLIEAVAAKSNFTFKEINSWSDERIRYYYTWKKSNNKRDVICDYIETFMKANNRFVS